MVEFRSVAKETKPCQGFQSTRKLQSWFSVKDLVVLFSSITIWLVVLLLNK